MPEPVNLTPYWAILEDPGRQWSIDEVASASFTEQFVSPHRDAESLNFGLRRSAIWLRVTLVNNSESGLDRLLEIPFPLLRQVDLYIPDANGFSHMATGYDKPFVQRPIDHRHFVFPLHLPANSQGTYYLRIASSTSLDVRAILWDPAVFDRQSLREYVGQSVFFGMMLALGVYNLLLFVALRDRSFLYYVFFVASTGLALVAHSGMGYQFLWPESTAWTRIASMVGFALAGGIALPLFQRSLLATAETVPRLDLLMRIFIVLNVVHVLGFFLLPFEVMVLPGTAMDGVNILLALVVGIACKLRGQRSAGLFLLAFACLVMAAITMALRGLGLNGIPNFLAVYGLQIGSALEMLLLSFTLADRFNQIKKEKETAQQELVDSLKRSERILEQRVSERTAELQRTNQDLLEQERALKSAREVAEEASRMKSAFLANMSHEIRTPMNAVIGLAHLALRTELSAEQRDYLEKIHGAAVALLRILNDVLDFSKIEAGKLTIERIDFSLNDMLGQVRAVTYQQAADKGLEYLFDIAADVPLQLRGDSLRLSQVLINLLNNAIKFTDEGRVLLRCSVESQNGETVRLCFEVKDTGIGISPDQQKKLFHAFTQADETITRKYGGTGLGLAISKRLVDLMGGRISIASAAGAGSSFRFTLDFGQCKPTPLRQRPAGRTVPCFAGRVLLVEDNEVNQQIAREMLNAAGLQVDVANNGRLALEQLFAAGPDAYRLVLMDIQMPEMSGHAATRRLRMDQRFAQLPIIAMTAHASGEERAECIRSGMQDHIAKPIQPDLFYRTLAHWLAPESSCARAVVATMPGLAALPVLPGFDTEEALERFSGDTDLYHRVLTLLESNLAVAIERFNAAVTECDRRAAKSAVHGIRGMACDAGATELATAAAALEKMLGDNNAHPEHAHAAHLAAFHDLANRTMSTLHQALAGSAEMPAS
ncbi:hybrid sensor histidine kinase/response regulator LadS [Noviherbaspirillum agri]